MRHLAARHHHAFGRSGAAPRRLGPAPPAQPGRSPGAAVTPPGTEPRHATAPWNAPTGALVVQHASPCVYGSCRSPRFLIAGGKNRLLPLRARAPRRGPRKPALRDRLPPAPPTGPQPPRARDPRGKTKVRRRSLAAPDGLVIGGLCRSKTPRFGQFLHRSRVILCRFWMR